MISAGWYRIMAEFCCDFEFWVEISSSIGMMTVETP
jgi:hypothetical protein